MQLPYTYLRAISLVGVTALLQSLPPFSSCHQVQILPVLHYVVWLPRVTSDTVTHATNCTT